MALIREIVQQALTTGYLSLAAEDKLHQLVQVEFEEEDIDALMRLEQAAIAGTIKKESQPLKPSSPRKREKGIVKMKLVCQTAFASAIVATIVFALPKNPDQGILSPNVNSTFNRVK
jgi:hypothetical protein